MTLTPGDWAAIDAIVSQHCPNPALAEAVRAAYLTALQQTPQPPPEKENPDA